MKVEEKKIGSVIMIFAILLSVVLPVLATTYQSKNYSKSTFSNELKNCVIQIAAGESHSLALKKDGSVWAWGNNFSGQVGNGTNIITIFIPEQVKGLKDVVAIAAGDNYSLALKKDGTVWAWGNNSSGQLGNGTTKDSNIPVQVKGLKDVIAISAGENYSIALKKDGTVWNWGESWYGQFGNSTTGYSTVPVQIKGLKDVVAIAADSDHSLVLKKDGTVWAWGNNSSGQLGNGNSTIEYSTIPVKVKGLKDVIAIAIGGCYSLALKRDGTVWAWGDNSSGQLGNGTTVNSPVPVQVRGLKDVVAIAAGDFHSLALKRDGTVWAWGDNSWGQLGNGTGGCDKYSTIPVRVKGLKDVVAIAAGGNFYSLALKRDGTVWAWGNNEHHQLGNGNGGYNKYSTSPEQVKGLK
ncbi:RCC1 domain-containing protein, partial [Caldicellulosiruptor acetigenus]|uniref:RCC1 domain-containing protein n=1 Tax=Caldicellulosiruptor acetigenus TaxID=301953 RepID=UPI000426A079